MQKQKEMTSNAKHVCEIMADKAKLFIENDGHLLPVLFVGSHSKNTLDVIGIADFKNKDAAAFIAKELVKKLEAEYTLFICEGRLMKIEAKEEELMGLIKKHGSVSNIPVSKKIEGVNFLYEDIGGHWVAFAEVTKKGNSKTMGEVKFKYQDNLKGRFTNFIRFSFN